MAGGSGERFWPLSTKEKPKQLLNLVSVKSMIRETVDRILNKVEIRDIFVATNIVQVPGIKAELPDLPEENIIIEPVFRDTAAAIAYGSTYISKYEDNPTILVLAADHLISKVDEFINSITIAEKEAENGNIVTFGIKPTRPETGYGYIKLNSKELNQPTEVVRFMEKPNIEVAMDYLENGSYVWNSGMFIFKYSSIMNEINSFVPNHIKVINNMIKYIKNENGKKLSNSVKEEFNNFERISIDFAVMEKSDIVKCIPVDIGWNDIGGYNSLFEVFETDKNGNIIRNCKYKYIDSYDNIVISDDENILITSVGVKNSIIVKTSNNLLICNRENTSDLKKLIKEIGE